MKSIGLLSGALCALLFGLSAAEAIGAPTESPAPQDLGSWGFGLGGQDKSVKPGDDFNAYANGAFIAHLTIPADQTSYGSFNVLSDLSEARVHAVLEDAARKVRDVAPASSDGKVGAAYKAFMDEARVESLGTRPLETDLAQVRAIKTRKELALLMGRSVAGMQTSLFDVSLQADDKDPNRYVIKISQGGIGLPDRDYFLTAAFASKKAAYQAYVAKMLGLIGWSDPVSSAKAVVEFESQVAQASWSKAQLRDPQAVYNPMTVTELQQLAPGLDWSALMNGAQLGMESRVVIDAKSAFAKLAAVYAQTPIETLKAWEAFRLADNAATYLPKRFVDARFEFRSHTLAGVEVIRPRWKRAVQTVNNELGEAVGEIYTTRFFPADSKAKMQTLIGNLKTALGARIERLAWMSPATKAEALKKLAHYDIQIGYPKKWRDYSHLTIRADDPLGNAQRSEAFEWAYQLARLHKAVDKDEWEMTPQTVNAYNEPNFNEVVFPAAILQPPFFNPAADPAVNYGAIGAVIGHEMTHGFDDQGRQYDADGRLRDWWTAEDAKRFGVRAAQLGEFYGKIDILPDLHINGQLTMGENIADLGGLLTALDAYHVSLGGKPAPVLDGLTGDQRFFLGFAQIWREKQRVDALRQQLVADPHSPAKARVNGVLPDVDDWYHAFNVMPGDKLYVAPEQRVRIW